MAKPMAKLMFRKGRRGSDPGLRNWCCEGAGAISLFIMNPRVQIAIGDIDHKVDHHNHGGDEKDDPLDDRKVPLSNGLENQPPNPRQMEDVLNDDRACKKIACLKPTIVTMGITAFLRACL